MKKQYFPFLFFFLLTSLSGWSQSKVTSFMIEAPQLQTSKKIWLYLPHNYNTSKKKYPVIYMHDAQNLFDNKTSYAGEWHVDETLDSLKAEVIIVGIEQRKEKRMDVEQALGRLAPELREVILLIYFGDCKLKEVADILQIGLPLVKYRHKGAKEELIKLLGEEDSDEFEKDDAKL